MGMTYTFKDANGNMVFSIEGVNSVSDNEISLESMYSNIVKKGNEIDNALDKFNFVSNTRAMEALGYMATEGFKDNIKKVASNISEAIRKFFHNIVEFFKGVLAKINEKLNKGSAKQAAASIVRRLKNPRDLQKDKLSEEIEKMINSDDMGIYVAVRKNLTTLFKLQKIVHSSSALHDKDFSKIDEAVEKIKDIKESASKVSAGEKRSNTIDFYKIIASGNFDTFKSEVGQLEHSATVDRDKFESEKSGMNEEYVKHLYPYYTNMYKLTAEYSKVIARLSSMTSIAAKIEAAASAKNETFDFDDPLQMKASKGTVPFYKANDASKPKV